MLYLLRRNTDSAYDTWCEMKFDGELFDGKEIELIDKNNVHRAYIYHVADEIIEANNYHDLDWEKVLLDPNSDYGYIDPDGNFYGCRYGTHTDFARLVLKRSEPEEFGWVKVYSTGDEVDYYTRRTFLTEAQIKTLSDRNIEISDFDIPK